MKLKPKSQGGTQPRHAWPFALVFTAQTVDVLARDGREGDAMALLIHLNLNPSSYFDDERAARYHSGVFQNL
jgi:hypothetical protein